MAQEGSARCLARRARVVGALSAHTAALNIFGTSARRSGWNARVVGALLASLARPAAAGPAKASRTQRKLTGYVMDDSSIRTAVAAWFDDRSGAEAAYGHISTWDTSGVTNMMWLFCGASWSACNTAAASFNEDIGAWDTSGVTTMYEMFREASAFNQDIGAWDTSGVTTMLGMFGKASAFNQDLSGWAIHSVTNMVYMFKEASAFNQDLGWCVDEDVDFDPWGDGYTFQDTFSGTPCEATSCGVAVCAPTPGRSVGTYVRLRRYLRRSWRP